MRVPNADVSDVGRVLKVRVVRVESDRGHCSEAGLGYIKLNTLIK
ncbi:MAG: hypothetical protein QXS42_03315 [Zestosphaera sp.]